jgi:hypothetical protein
MGLFIKLATFVRINMETGQYINDLISRYQKTFHRFDGKLLQDT